MHWGIKIRASTTDRKERSGGGQQAWKVLATWGRDGETEEAERYQSLWIVLFQLHALRYIEEWIKCWALIKRSICVLVYIILRRNWRARFSYRRFRTITSSARECEWCAGERKRASRPVSVKLGDQSVHGVCVVERERGVDTLRCMREKKKNRWKKI